MDNYCEWAPWVFAVVAGILGWLLRWWYDEGKFSEFRDRLSAKDNDIFHLNEAHNLLLEDKKAKIGGHSDELALKERVINELQAEIRKLKQPGSKSSELAKKSKDQKIAKKSLTSPVSLVSRIDKKAKEKTVESPVTASQKGDSEIVKKVSSIQHDSKEIEERGGRGSDKFSKKDRLKKKIEKRNRLIQKLKAQKADLIKQLASGPMEIIKERPVTITKTILIKEKVNRKKLNKAIKNVPFKRSKKGEDVWL